jgi:hypothetical protein
MIDLIFTTKGIIKWVLFYLTINKEFREYHHFPFNYNKPLPNNALTMMSLCCNILENMGITYRLTDGTILGLYRQGDFIPHDNDIDVDVLDCREINMICERMKSVGMKLGRKAVYKNQIQQLVFYNDEEAVFDMIFWYSNGEIIYNYSERGYVRSQEKRFFEKLSQIEFKRKKYPIPSHIEEWLTMRFGHDWKLPKKYKGDWKKECGDLKLIESKQDVN